MGDGPALELLHMALSSTRRWVWISGKADIAELLPSCCWFEAEEQPLHAHSGRQAIFA